MSTTQPISLSTKGTDNETATRVMLDGDETMSLHIRPTLSRVRVVDGQAWISYEGKDYVLSYGEEITLPRGKYQAIIMALYHRPLTFELLPN
ncbi:MAG: DUF2917 domain-containing protein [Anaerolineae bacterium]|nr:DUF2917 domain-containing protein [Anaerolineae bacterium]